MGQEKGKKDKILLRRQIEEEGSLFDDDLDVEDIGDEFLKLRSYRKSTAFFRAMVISPDFPLSPDQELVVREYGFGNTDDQGRIYGPTGKEFSSLSLMAKSVMPEVRTVDKRSEIERAANPDGWDVVSVNFDGEQVKLSTLFYDHWKKIGLGMEDFSSDGKLIEAMEKRGLGEYFQDLKPKPKKRSAKKTVKKTAKKAEKKPPSSTTKKAPVKKSQPKIRSDQKPPTTEALFEVESKIAKKEKPGQ